MTRRANIVSYDDALRARPARERYIPSSADAMGHIVDLSDRLNDGFVSPFRTGGAGAASQTPVRPRLAAGGSAAARSSRPAVSMVTTPAASRIGYAPAAYSDYARASRRTRERVSSASVSYGQGVPSSASYGRNTLVGDLGRTASTPSWYDQGFDLALYSDGFQDDDYEPRSGGSRRTERGGRSGGVGLPSLAVPVPQVRRGGSSTRTAPSWYERPADGDVFWDEGPAAADEASRSHSAVYTPDDYEEDVRREGEASGRSKREERKRAKRKEKADRKFDRQFGSDDAASAAAAGGSRAAVYKGEMGSKQRKATRMQRDGANEGARTLAASNRKERTGNRVLLGLAKVAAVAGIAVVLGAFLYEPAQQYYQALREHDRLEAEYQAVEERRGRLQADLADLQTDSGLEARAHQQLGWVKKGEQTANVRGLDVEITENSLLQANIDPADIELPQTWYSPILDPFFGVE